MNHTPNYNLSQWEKSDKVLMDDFNADNAKLDAALKRKAEQSALNALSQTVSGHTAAVAKLGNCQIETFTYAGTGGSGSTRTEITFPRLPVLALILDGYGCFILTWPGLTSGYYHGSENPVHFRWNGSLLSMNSSSEQFQMNAKGARYKVIAFYAQDAE